METKNEIIESIIKHHFPIAFNENQYTFQMVKNICQSVWDIANDEVDDICELKAEKAKLKYEGKRNIELLNQDIKNLNQIIDDTYLQSCIFESKLNEQYKLVDTLKAEIDLLQLEVADWEAKYSNLESDIEILKENEYEKGFEAGDRGNIF